MAKPIADTGPSAKTSARSEASGRAPRTSPPEEGPGFFTPERFAEEVVHRAGSPRGELLIASCRSGSRLARRVVERYRQRLVEAGNDGDVPFLQDIDRDFSDSETCVRLEMHVGGYDVFLFQGLYDPVSGRHVDENYLAFLIAARTFREHGAAHVTAVLPYLAYARQDKPTRFRREPTTAKLMADLSAVAGIDRMVTWHPHSKQIRGFYANLPVDLLDPLSFFVQEFERFAGRDDVVAVAPDAGASKLVTYFARALELRSAIASKYRPAPEEAAISEVIGDLAGKRVALVLDDMISSGGTVDAVVRKLVEDKGLSKVYLGISHNLCTGQAYERLSALHSDYHLRQAVVTNSIPQTDAFQALPFVTVRDLSDTLAQVINRIHYNRSVSSLFYQDSQPRSAHPPTSQEA
jgi:ribose-phosphate pyrophosphokinase